MAAAGDTAGRKTTSNGNSSKQLEISGRNSEMGAMMTGRICSHSEISRKSVNIRPETEQTHTMQTSFARDLIEIEYVCILSLYA